MQDEEVPSGKIFQAPVFTTVRRIQSWSDKPNKPKREPNYSTLNRKRFQRTCLRRSQVNNLSTTFHDNDFFSDISFDSLLLHLAFDKRLAVILALVFELNRIVCFGRIYRFQSSCFNIFLCILFLTVFPLLQIRFDQAYYFRLRVASAIMSSRLISTEHLFHRKLA